MMSTITLLRLIGIACTPLAKPLVIKENSAFLAKNQVESFFNLAPSKKVSKNTMKSIKYILPVSFCLILLSCTPKPSSAPKDQPKKDVKFDLFPSDELNIITNDYINFLKQQEDTALHDQYVKLYFYEKDNQIKFYLSTDRYIGVHTDSRYAYLYMVNFEGTKIFISDRKVQPLGHKYYSTDKLSVIDDERKYQPVHPYSINVFDEMIWYYTIKDNKFILDKKE